MASPALPASQSRARTVGRRLLTVLLAGTLSGAGLLGLAPAAHAVNEGYLDVTVTDTIGQPLPGASVQVFPANVPLPDPVNDPNWHPDVLQSAASDVDGVAHLVFDFDTTTLSVNVLVEATGFDSRWYNAAPDYANADDVSLSNGNTTTIGFSLIQQLRVVQVNTWDFDTGADLAGTTVGLYDASGDGTTPVATATSDTIGRATFRLAVGSLPSGTYRAGASHAGYLDGWYVDTGQPNDFAHAIDLDLTGPKAFYSIDIPLTAGTPVAFIQAPKPTVAGKAKKGRTLTCKTGSWVPAPTFRYQWYRGSKKISGATAKKYTLRKADIGKRMWVKVKGVRIGYVTTTRNSAKTSTVKP